MIRVACTFPSCEGLFVIFALPSSVSIIAPLTRIFCLARKVFDGVSRTFLIADFFDFPFAITFAMLFENETSFFVLPRPASSFVFFSPIFTILAWLCLPVSFFFFGFLYRPPDIFLPVFIVEKEKFGLNRLWFLVIYTLPEECLRILLN